MIKYFYILLFTLIGSSIYSQVELNGKLIFISNTDSLRQVTGLSNTDSLDEAVSSGELPYKNLFDDEVSVVDTNFILITNFEFPNLKQGMILKIMVPQLTDTINVPFNVVINNSIPYKIKTINQSQINSNYIKSNILLNLIFTGTEFVCLNNEIHLCPNGFQKINNNYCIQKNRNASTTFWLANKNCNDNGYHLCTFQEWYYACINNTNLNQIPLNYEWVHSTANHFDQALQLGTSGICTNRLSAEPTDITYFRCCYSLR